MTVGDVFVLVGAIVAGLAAILALARPVGVPAMATALAAVGACLVGVGVLLGAPKLGAK